MKKKGKNVLEIVKTFLLAINARYKKERVRSNVLRPRPGDNLKIARRLFHQNLAAVRDVDAAAADAA